MHTISFIIPCYNSSKTIVKTLNSIYHQQNSDVFFDIIIVNDGSTDNSLEIINNYIKDCSLKNIFVYSSENRGPLMSRIAGIKIAKGEYIYCIDSDDYISNNFLSIFSNIIKNHPYDLIVVPITRICRGHVINISTEDSCLTLKEYFDDNLIYGKYGYTACKIFKKSILHYDELLKKICGKRIDYTEDLLMSLFIDNKDFDIPILKNASYFYDVGLSDLAKKTNLNAFTSWLFVRHQRYEIIIKKRRDLLEKFLLNEYITEIHMIFKIFKECKNKKKIMQLIIADDLRNIFSAKKAYFRKNMSFKNKILSFFSEIYIKNSNTICQNKT